MSTQEIISEALQLPRPSRALLAEKLLESLDDGDDFSVSAEWHTEIRRRCDELDRGVVKTIPADEVFAEAEKILG
ncbi:MAG: addiction module protein [Verrucomicrobia bacterium]|nr:addiction module protein [Verrucomicrobiota bacterium]